MTTFTVTQENSRQLSSFRPSGDADNEEDETLMERLIGLGEMFPESVRSASSKTSSFIFSSTVRMFSLSKSALWVFATSAAILVLPVMFEIERTQVTEQQLQQQRQILLGPTAAVSGGMAQNMPGLMPMPQK